MITSIKKHAKKIFLLMTFVVYGSKISCEGNGCIFY